MAVETMGAVKGFDATEALEAYRRVKFTSGSAVAVEYSDAEDDWIGVTQKKVAINMTVPVRLRTDTGTFKVTCTGACTVGDRLWPTADGKVDDAATANGRGCFIAMEAAAADGDWIEALPYNESTGLLYASVADATQIENTNVETAFDSSKTVNGAELEAGDVLEVIFSGYVLDQNGSDTLTLKLYVGTEEIVTTGAVTHADDDIAHIHAWITIRTVGSSASIVATGTYSLGVAGTVTQKPFRKAAATEDLSATFEVHVKATFSATHADNEVDCEQFIVIHHRQ